MKTHLCGSSRSRPTTGPPAAARQHLQPPPDPEPARDPGLDLLDRNQQLSSACRLATLGCHRQTIWSHLCSRRTPAKGRSLWRPRSADSQVTLRLRFHTCRVLLHLGRCCGWSCFPWSSARRGLRLCRRRRGRRRRPRWLGTSAPRPRPRPPAGPDSPGSPALQGHQRAFRDGGQAAKARLLDSSNPPVTVMRTAWLHCPAADWHQYTPESDW